MKLLRWYIPFVVALVIASGFTILNTGYSQDKEKTVIATRLYEMVGCIQALNLDENWALIDGRKWDLADDFDKKGISPVWRKKRKIEFKNRETWVNYYVILQSRAEASVDVEKRTRRKIKRMVDPDLIKEINEKGGKIYKIRICPT